MMVRYRALEVVGAQEFVGFGDAGGVAADKEFVVLADDSGNVAALAVGSFAQADGTVVDVDFDDEVTGDMPGDARCFDLMGFDLRNFHEISNVVSGQPIRTTPKVRLFDQYISGGREEPVAAPMPAVSPLLSAAAALYCPGPP